MQPQLSWRCSLCMTCRPVNAQIISCQPPFSSDSTSFLDLATRHRFAHQLPPPPSPFCTDRNGRLSLHPAAVRSYAYQLLTALACLHDSHAVARPRNSESLQSPHTPHTHTIGSCRNQHNTDCTHCRSHPPPLPLGVRVCRNGRMGLPPAAVRSYAHQLLTALACLHDSRAVVHRDVKPSNTLLQQPFVTRTGKVRGLGGRGGQSAAGEACMRGGGGSRPEQILLWYSG
jgi:hypothetical protein